MLAAVVMGGPLIDIDMVSPIDNSHDKLEETAWRAFD
jgi:hypothetical protein